MRGVLTQPGKGLARAVLGLLGLSPLLCLAAEPAAQLATATVPLASAETSSVRQPDALMTWKIQKLHYTDGAAIVTVAGVQFEEALGLSVVVIDPPPAELAQRLSAPAKSAESQSTTGSGQPSLPATQAPQTLFDISNSSEKRLPGEPPRAEIQIKNLLVDLNELTKPDSANRSFVPECERGARRAVVFVRPAQTARIFELGSARAIELSQYGRAACLRWDGIPEKI